MWKAFFAFSSSRFRPFHLIKFTSTFLRITADILTTVQFFFCHLSISLALFLFTFFISCSVVGNLMCNLSRNEFIVSETEIFFLFHCCCCYSFYALKPKRRFSLRFSGVNCMNPLSFCTSMRICVFECGFLCVSKIVLPFFFLRFSSSLHVICICSVACFISCYVVIR